MKDKDEEAFLIALGALTRVTGVVIGGCGCCGSPWLSRTEAKKGAYVYQKGSGMTWVEEKDEASAGT